MIEKIDIRFFIPDASEEDGIREVDEKEFDETDGHIQYDRNTVFENGCRQVCLTKYN